MSELDKLQARLQNKKYAPYGSLLDPIQCEDGFSFSVQASSFNYSIPRNNVGPYSHVEVGFPTQNEDSLIPYAKDSSIPTDPTDAVYGYVPIQIVASIIENHGGSL